MMHQRWGFPDKYRALLVAVLLVVCGSVHAQVYQRMPNRYNIREGVFDSSVGIPFGTTPSLRASIQQSNPGRLFYKTSDSSVQVWTGTQWLNVGGGTAINWGDIGGTLSDQTDLWAALNARVKYTDTATMLSTYLRSADTAWLHNAVTTIKATQDLTTFSDGLHKVGNNVVALHDEANWNAYKFQGRLVSSATPLNGQVYAWDSVGLQWVPQTVSSGSGSTPTFQQVLTAGSTLTGANTINMGGFTQTWTTSQAIGWAFTVNNTAGNAAKFTSTGSTAVTANTTTGTALSAQATAGGIALSGTTGSNDAIVLLSDYSNATTKQSIATFTRGTTGTATNGIGGMLTFNLEDASGATNTSNYLVWKYTTASNATRTSSFEIWGTNNGSVLPTKSIAFPALIQDLADNAAALTAGLTTGDVYRTGDTLKIVH